MQVFKPQSYRYAELLFFKDIRSSEYSHFLSSQPYLKGER
jgi:hypothetical protein